MENGAETFEGYSALRGSGCTKEEATLIMAKEAPLYILSAKADVYPGKINYKEFNNSVGQNGKMKKTRR